jgi:hypothetical protein
MECPVQITSKCANEKMKKMGSNPEDVPKLYCSSGTAECMDLDEKQMCICGSCSVWKIFVLAKAKPTDYYCFNGKAK